MKKLLFIAIILLLLVLIITNPSQSDYNSWVNKNLADELDYDSKGTLGKALSPLTDVVVNTVTDRDNYFFFSVYKTKLIDTEISKTLGICKVFIRLD